MEKLLKIIVEYDNLRAIFAIILYSPFPKDVGLYDMPTNIFEKGVNGMHDYLVRYVNEHYSHLPRDSIVVCFKKVYFVEPVEYELSWEWEDD